jgi:alkylation response protein AidB-like acyl-CoA dehydrogenase
MVVAEELAAACGGFATSIMVTTLPIRALMLFGTEAQQQEFLPRLTKQLTFCSFAMTEPDAGQDLSAFTTRAERAGDDFVIRGAKQFISNASHADFFVTVAKLSTSMKSLTAFIVPANTPGVSVGKPDRKLGQRLNNTAPVFFDDVRVPASYRLGRDGQGAEVILKSLDLSRTGIGAMGVGIARAAIHDAIETGKARSRWGRPLIEHEHYLMRLAKMATDVTSARLLAHYSAWKMTQGQLNRVEACMSKMTGGNVAMQVTTEVVEMLGGMGYTRELMAEKRMRDAKLLQIYEGPTTTMLSVIGGQVANTF